MTTEGGRGWRTAGTIIAAIILAAGVAAGGWFVGRGLIGPRHADRYVTVKGLAERDVKADLALWPMRFVATGNDLGEVRAKIAQDEDTVRRFLTKGGVAKDSIEVRALDVTDLYAQVYRSGPVQNRFVISETLMVRTNDVARIAGLAQQVGTLVAAGVVLSNEGGPGPGGRPVYLFTKLNDVKPAMLSEATANARAAAAEFAKNSDSRLGGIRRASQGLFQILPRDDAPGIQQSSEIDKRLRVVSTVEYYLVD